MARNMAIKKLNRNLTLSLKSVETALMVIADRNPKAENRRADNCVELSFMDEPENTGLLK